MILRQCHSHALPAALSSAQCPEAIAALSPRWPRRRAASGFSLVELMVALALGLAVSALVIRIWSNNRQTFRSQDNRARVQENARQALQLLERELRLAGYRGFNQEALPFSQVFGDGAAASLPANTLPPALSGINDNETAGSLTSDTLSVAFYGSSPLNSSVADGTVSNCLGVPQAANVLVQDTFTVKIDASTGIPALFCTSSLNGVAGAQTVVTYSIETLQVLYGEEVDGQATGISNQFVHAGQVVNFNNVAQVRISVLARGEDRSQAQVAASAGAATTTLVNTMRSTANSAPYGALFYHFGSPYAKANPDDTGAVSNLSTLSDGRSRSLYGTTVSLRNRTS